MTDINKLDDFIERCENRLSLIKNKLHDNTKLQQSIKDSANKTKSSLANHVSHIKEMLCRMVDQSFETTCLEIDDIATRDESYIQTYDDGLSNDLEKLNELLIEVKSMKGNDNVKIQDTMVQTLNEAGKSFIDLPVVSLSFSTKIDETLLMQVCERTKELLKLNMTGNVQITECLERPGSIIINWDEQQMSDSESITTDASMLTEYVLQMCDELPKEGEPMIFRTVYEGEEMQYTLNFAEPEKIYSFRVCQFHSSSTKCGMLGPWSMVKQASTSLAPHVWREEDCVTDSGFQLYQLSNKDRTATKVFPESSRILRSKNPSYTIGETITFCIEETGESSMNDGIGFISRDEQSFKHLKCSENAAVLNTKGAIFVNGVQMVTKLPGLKKNSIVGFHVKKEKSGKLRVSISIDDKEVTFDWTVAPEFMKTNQLFFACGFEHTGWQLSVV